MKKGMIQKEFIYMGQNEMADDFDELFRMGKKNDFPWKKLFLTQKEYFIEPLLFYLALKKEYLVLKFISIVSRTFIEYRIKKIILKR